MSIPCNSCGTSHLVTVRIPGHDDVEAVLCLACGTAQQPHDLTPGRTRTDR